MRRYGNHAMSDKNALQVDKDDSKKEDGKASEVCP